MPEDPLVSIIIPTHDRAHLLGSAVRSCLGQSYGSVEVIVVDDASTDGTAAVIEDLVHEGAGRVSAVRCDVNRGPSAARNLGLLRARGEYVRFLDSDDTLAPDAVEHLVQAARATGADLCISSRCYMAPDGTVHDVAFEPPAGRVDAPVSRFFDLDLRPQTGLWFFHRRLFDRGLRWDEGLLAREDTDLIGRALVAGATVVGVPEARVHQRFHPGPRQGGRQFEPPVLRAILRANRALLRAMEARDLLPACGRSFARSLCRTSLRAWPIDRRLALAFHRLARRAHPVAELVLLPSYPRPVRVAAYALWAAGGPRLCGPVMQGFHELKERVRARRRRTAPAGGRPSSPATARSRGAERA